MKGGERVSTWSPAGVSESRGAKKTQRGGGGGGGGRRVGNRSLQNNRGQRFITQTANCGCTTCFHGYLWLQLQSQAPPAHGLWERQEAEPLKRNVKGTHLFAYVLHHELQLLGLLTLTIEEVPPQGGRQHAVIREDPLQTHTYFSYEHTLAAPLNPHLFLFFFLCLKFLHIYGNNRNVIQSVSPILSKHKDLDLCTVKET